MLSKAIKFIILEGIESDKAELNELYPESKQEISKLSPKWIMWLYARFGPNPKREEIHPFEDALTTILAFSKKDSAINQKYSSSEQWRKAVDLEFDPQKRKWKTPADSITMSVDDMETLLAMSERKKQNVDIKEANVEGDFLTKIGPWNLWIPSTKENSCVIAGTDPLTGKSSTTWCTARTSGSNLFYNYVVQDNANIVLFYVIKDNAIEPNDRISIGFIDGKPQFQGNGGVSVNGENEGVTEQILKSIFGSYYDSIMNILFSKSAEIAGEHPAKIKIKQAAVDLKTFDNILRGLSTEEALDMKRMIGSQKEMSIEVAMQLATDENFSVRENVGSNPNIPLEALMQLATDKSVGIRIQVASNIKTPPEVLIQLANDKDYNIRYYVGTNHNTPVEVLIQLAKDDNRTVRAGIISNPKIPNEVLIQLTNDEDKNVSIAAKRKINVHEVLVHNVIKRIKDCKNKS